ncbi:MAG: ATP-binding protein [Elusimicrobia bacterium]|nr:ATP-binding protein [Elusimicrobiota bacterium]
MVKIEAPAILANLEKMTGFTAGFAEKQGFNKEAVGQIRLASEEALINVINYAYPGAEGTVEVSCDTAGGGAIRIEIKDSGIPFDPLSLPAPDTTLPMEQRKIGGLGIFMIRKLMSDVKYRRDGGCNVLTLIKNK